MKQVRLAMVGPKCQEEGLDRSIGDEEESGEHNQLTIGLGDDSIDLCIIDQLVRFFVAEPYHSGLSPRLDMHGCSYFP
jgi:hypothetical protein